MRTGASPSLWHRPPEPVTYKYIPFRLRKSQGSRTPQPRVQCGAYEAEPAQREVLLEPRVAGVIHQPLHLFQHSNNPQIYKPSRP